MANDTAIRTDFLAIATAQIDMGIPVIPVRAGQKQPPLVTNGTLSASTNQEQVEAWARQFPDANVGVVCTAEGICIIDDDEGVVAASGILVDTRIVESSPGHRQYYFRQTPESRDVGNLTQRGGFSLRAHNFYGLAAGSLHPSGHHYTVLKDSPICPMPAELLRYLQEKNAGAKTALGGQLQNLDGRKLGEGEGRNDDMTRLAGLLWDGQRDEEEFVEDLTWACEQRHDPPYPESRIRELVRRIMNDEKWKPHLGFDLADLLSPGEDPGFWVGLQYYASKESLEASRPRALTLKQLDAQIRTARSLEELVPGMFPVRAVNIIGGDSGLGKSPLLCQLAVCVASGIPFLGHTVKKSRVLIADYENDVALAGMLHSVAQAVGADEDALEESLFIIQRPDKRDLFADVAKTQARLVIVDSLRGLDPHAETGKQGQGSALISELQAVDCCWLLIHHLRKPAANADVAKPSLDDEDVPVLTWLEAMSGARSLVNQTFTRIGIDRTQKKVADLVFRGYIKGRGEFGPIYLDRTYNDTGDPIGFTALTGFGLLSLNQKADLQRVLASGTVHTWAGLVELLGAKSKASRLVNACKAAGLVQAAGGRYEFVEK